MWNICHVIDHTLSGSAIIRIGTTYYLLNDPTTQDGLTIV